MQDRRRVRAALAVALLIPLACNAPVGRATALPEATLEPISEPASEPAIAAVALRLDAGSPQLAGFLGPPGAAWRLPEGTYQISAVDQDGRIVRLSEVHVNAEPLTWPAEFPPAEPPATEEEAVAISVLVVFLMQAEEAKLAALEYSSDGFRAPLFSNEPGQAELDELYVRFALIAAQEAAVFDSLERVFGARLSELGSLKVAAPARGLLDSLSGFFGYAGGAGGRARERILRFADELSPVERADAFNAVRESFRSDAGDLDEFLDILSSGALDNQAAQIESDMRNAPGFGAVARTMDAGVGQVVHREGAELVSRGAALQVEVIKGVLGSVFPDITEGFDLADKADEWAEYIQAIYQDPLAVAEGEARDSLREKIKERILSDLQRCCPELAEDLAGELADRVSQEAVNAIPELASGPDDEQAPAALVIELQIDLLETVTGDVAANAASTGLELTADFRSGTIVGSLEGLVQYDAGRLCVNPSNPAETWDYMPISYVAAYTSEVSGNLDVESGGFSASIAPTGQVVDMDVVEPFTDSRCLKYNSDPPPEIGPFGGLGPFSGSGTITGVVSPTGEATVTTDWEAGRAQVSGTWSGQGAVAP